MIVDFTAGFHTGGGGPGTPPARVPSPTQDFENYDDIIALKQGLGDVLITPRLRRGRVIGPVCVCVCVCLSVCD